jgi:hypothetical protein
VQPWSPHYQQECDAISETTLRSQYSGNMANGKIYIEEAQKADCHINARNYW